MTFYMCYKCVQRAESSTRQHERKTLLHRVLRHLESRKSTQNTHPLQSISFSNKHSSCKSQLSPSLSPKEINFRWNSGNLRPGNMKFYIFRLQFTHIYPSSSIPFILSIMLNNQNLRNLLTINLSV